MNRSNLLSDMLKNFPQNQPSQFQKDFMKHVLNCIVDMKFEHYSENGTYCIISDNTSANLDKAFEIFNEKCSYADLRIIVNYFNLYLFEMIELEFKSFAKFMLSILLDYLVFNVQIESAKSDSTVELSSQLLSIEITGLKQKAGLKRTGF